MKKLFVCLICFAVFVPFVAAVAADFGKPEDAIEYRKAAMSLMGTHFKGMAAVIKGEKPYDKEAFAVEARLFDTLFSLPWEAFAVLGSEKGDTTMTAAALEQPDKFKAETEQFQTAVKGYISAAESGDLGAVKSAFGQVAKTCKSCHEAFRKK